MYHVHRIPVIGNNTFLNPWYLNLEPPIEIEMAIIREEYEKFAKVIFWKYISRILINLHNGVNQNIFYWMYWLSFIILYIGGGKQKLKKINIKYWWII